MIHRGVCFFALLFTALLVAEGQTAEPVGKVIYAWDFSDFGGGSVLQWLQGKGFIRRRDASSSSKVNLSFQNRALVLETKRPALGLLIDNEEIPAYSRVRIEWGVEVFPPGASYKSGIRSDAVMIYIFLAISPFGAGPG